MPARSLGCKREAMGTRASFEHFSPCCQCKPTLVACGDTLDRVPRLGADRPVRRIAEPSRSSRWRQARAGARRDSRQSAPPVVLHRRAGGQELSSRRLDRNRRARSLTFGGRRAAAHTAGVGRGTNRAGPLKGSSLVRSGGDQRPAAQAGPPNRPQAGLPPDLLGSCSRPRRSGVSAETPNRPVFGGT